ncbi:winged helix-turn-helix transcriptional regulator [Natronobacterium texcoconense]|uniref:DNA-binding transcriptional regulator, HxlR family n=1 Tax=Natronobacterium texcoconense TaxID=1095778 RepID=A0A1H1HZ95_NATTX|nr:helix-turn-helix domain-containing protein [Natronobacterium texcoconense]SDR30785.1 DNA-binding transcriptional regulator, HxlR family [Natronobacterium texcoconense]
MSENPTSTDTGRQKPAENASCCCPIGGVLDLLSRKYAIQVICVVGALEPVRYGEIEDAFGDVSSSTLSARLNELTDADLLEREQHDTIPPQVEYRLTTDGTELCELLQPLVRWAEDRSLSEQ